MTVGGGRSVHPAPIIRARLGRPVAFLHAVGLPGAAEILLRERRSAHVAVDIGPGGPVDVPTAGNGQGWHWMVVTDAAKLAQVAVTAEVVAHTKGPKIRIHKFKNKTGYHKRQGHRQPLTQVKVTGISTGK